MVRGEYSQIFIRESFLFQACGSDPNCISGGLGHIPQRGSGVGISWIRPCSRLLCNWLGETGTTSQYDATPSYLVATKHHSLSLVGTKILRVMTGARVWTICPESLSDSKLPWVHYTTTSLRCQLLAQMTELTGQKMFGTIPTMFYISYYLL